jgi:flagellar motor component MotA
MTHDEFVDKYTEIAGLALQYSEKARREGLLALEEDTDQEKFDERDVFECGLRLIVDGTDAEFVEKILSNIVKQEKDEDMAILKNIQKEAVLMIQEGVHPRLVCLALNSYTNIAIKDDKIYKMVENKSY